MPTTLLQCPTVQAELLTEGGPMSIEAMMAQLPDHAQEQINQAAAEMVAQIPAFSMSLVGRHIILKRARDMAIEFALFGYHMGFQHAAHDAAEFPGKTPTIG